MEDAPPPPAGSETNETQLPVVPQARIFPAGPLIPMDPEGRIRALSVSQDTCDDDTLPAQPLHDGVATQFPRPPVLAGVMARRRKSLSRDSEFSAERDLRHAGQGEAWPTAQRLFAGARTAAPSSPQVNAGSTAPPASDGDEGMMDEGPGGDELGQLFSSLYDGEFAPSSEPSESEAQPPADDQFPSQRPGFDDWLEHEASADEQFDDNDYSGDEEPCLWCMPCCRSVVHALKLIAKASTEEWDVIAPFIDCVPLGSRCVACNRKHKTCDQPADLMEGNRQECDDFLVSFRQLQCTMVNSDGEPYIAAAEIVRAASPDEIMFSEETRRACTGLFFEVLLAFDEMEKAHRSRHKIGGKVANRDMPTYNAEVSRRRTALQRGVQPLSQHSGVEAEDAYAVATTLRLSKNDPLGVSWLQTRRDVHRRWMVLLRNDTLCAARGDESGSFRRVLIHYRAKVPT
ncbi:uncharacterized protein J7T54_001545 [Emericellopsis cladophorae]|uniref:Uncharacterized protein n=1 Tax=Emericellopsis cladophorae TaxID=2686198 RepID=A0A9P9XTM0_9HYPO|nr:uncharacterized protein J7T54_001545 [Emericellopsis cladophorae]KAI6777595.1 hypothetical protein J7T54_001545 [Emericellopsis cladophorae]